MYSEQLFNNGEYYTVHSSGRVCWTVIGPIDQYNPIFNHFGYTDCVTCSCINTCPYSLDEYNTGGDCLGLK
jgi:hypothetical protein